MPSARLPGVWGEARPGGAGEPSGTAAVQAVQQVQVRQYKWMKSAGYIQKDEKCGEVCGKRVMWMGFVMVCLQHRLFVWRHVWHEHRTSAEAFTIPSPTSSDCGQD